MIPSAGGPSEAMIAALTDLWRLPTPGPGNLLADPAFLRLCEACRAGYPSSGPAGPNFALSAALRSLGLPCLLPPVDGRNFTQWWSVAFAQANGYSRPVARWGEGEGEGELDMGGSNGDFYNQCRSDQCYRHISRLSRTL
jgi:hypothetical protein